MQSREIVFYVESLRRGKKLTINELIQDIVSLRQFKRYLYGESNIPTDVLFKLCRRLNIEPITAIKNYDKSLKEENFMINTLHKHIVSKRFKEAENTIKHLRSSSFYSERNSNYFGICNSLYMHQVENLSDSRYIELISKEISYPELLKSDVIDLVEAFGLVSIVKITKNNEEKQKIMMFLLEKISLKGSLIEGDSSYIYPYVIISLAKEFGKSEDVENVISLCNIGINNQKSNNSSYGLSQLHYYASLANNSINDISMRNHHIAACYYSLKLNENDKNKIERLTNVIKKDYGNDILVKVIMSELSN